RRTAAQRAVLCDVEPAAFDGARDGRQRALDRDQSRRSRRGETLAIGPLRFVDRLPQLQPGRYLDIVRSYARYYPLAIKDETLREEALAWALGRGSRSGRVAWQYIQDLAGRLGTKLYLAVAAWSPMNLVGSTGREPLRSSKCTCGWLTEPVAPALAMIWPRRTLSPRLTRISSLCA